MAISAEAAAASPRGWLRGPSFDATLIFGVAALALASGALVVARPRLFPWVLLADVWLLGYHHVVATFTRLAFDSESFARHRFLILWLPPIVLAASIALLFGFGGWILSTTYLYWQWFHYTRQSYGIERAYRRKSGDLAVGGESLTRWALYLVPLWGILHRSHQAPERFLGVELRVIPVPGELALATGVAALALLGLWLAALVQRLASGEPLQAHSLYFLSHTLIFVVGYLVIADLDHGWLVLNVWHNAQYILFVWMFNEGRFREGVDSRHPFLSRLSQQRNWPWYFGTLLLISSVLYFGLQSGLGVLESRTALPLFLVAYQAINFHHYLVDGVIWKMRQRRVRETLGLG